MTLPTYNLLPVTHYLPVIPQGGGENICRASNQTCIVRIAAWQEKGGQKKDRAHGKGRRPYYLSVQPAARSGADTPAGPCHREEQRARRRLYRRPK